MPPPAGGSTSSGKRPAGRDASISPPPLKRKAQSAISSSAVASFFTPASQKPKERTEWSERSPDEDSLPTLLVAKYVPEGEAGQPSKRAKIAAFDLDSTLITTASGKKHSDDASDWKWWNGCVPARLRQLYEEGYQIVVLSNQGGLTLHTDPKSKAPKNLGKKRVTAFKQKCGAVLAQLDLPILLYAATGQDIFRKPRTGMWREMCGDCDLGSPSDVDLENSLFVGDAGGRTAAKAPKDFSCSDRNLAHNLGIRYQTPEEFFLGERPREFARDFDIVDFPFAADPARSSNSSVEFEKKDGREIVLFCGPPGAGKSTFYWKHLEPLGYERVNQDSLKSREKCLKAATEFLQDGESVVIDNTNPEPDTRKQWVELARKNKASIRCVWFRTPLRLCEHNNAVRSLNKSLNPESRPSLPKLAFNGFASRFKEPQLKEGFEEIVEVEFAFRGTKEEYEIWGKYWL